MRNTTWLGLGNGPQTIQGPSGPVTVQAPPGGALLIYSTEAFAESDHDVARRGVSVGDVQPAQLTPDEQFVAKIVHDLRVALADHKLDASEAARLGIDIASHAGVQSAIKSAASELAVRISGLLGRKAG